MRPEERKAILWQGVTVPERPGQKRRLDALVEDLRSSPVRGRPLELRLRNFVPSADSYLASLGGPLPYMLRLREIEAATAAHEAALRAAWREIADEATDDASFAEAWRRTVDGWSFDEVNDLIRRHNRWYPVESRLPMDPRTGDFVRVNGNDYRRAPLGSAWALERFPPSLSLARAARLPAAVL